MAIAIFYWVSFFASAGLFAANAVVFVRSIRRKVVGSSRSNWWNVGAFSLTSLSQLMFFVFTFFRILGWFVPTYDNSAQAGVIVVGLLLALGGLGAVALSSGWSRVTGVAAAAASGLLWLLTLSAYSAA